MSSPRVGTAAAVALLALLAGCGGDDNSSGSGTDQLDGQDVVAVDNTADDGTATAYILLDDPHYVLKVEKTAGEDQGAVEFSDFDQPFDVDAPTPDEVVDLSQLG